MMFYFVKKRKMYCVLCVYTEHPLVISETQLSVLYSAAVFLGAGQQQGCVFVSFAVSFPPFSSS